MRQPINQGTGSRFSIPPGRHATAVSEAERIDTVLRSEAAQQSHEALKSEVDLAARMEERIARTTRMTVPVGRRVASMPGSARGGHRAATTEGESVSDSGVAERGLQSVARVSESDATGVDAKERASG